MTAGYQEPGIHDPSTPISGLRVSSFGSLPTTSNPTLRRCSVPSSKVCHQQASTCIRHGVQELCPPCYCYINFAGKLQYQRAQNRVIMFYRIYHHIVEVSVHHLLLITNSRAHGYVTNRICQISTMQSRHLRILIPATIIVALNNIPATIRYLPSVDNCRHNIHTIGVSEIFHY